MRDGRLEVPEPADHPLHRGRRHRARHLARVAARASTRRCSKAYGGKRTIAWLEVLAGEKAKNQLNSWLPDETLDGHRPAPGRDQGPAHHAGRRRLPLAQRGAAPEARSLRLRPAGALVRGRALAGQGAGGRGHGDLPREHRGHLRRHRVQGRDRRGPAGDRLPPAARWASQTIRFPETSAIGIKPISEEGSQAADPRGHRLRRRPEVAPA